MNLIRIKTNLTVPIVMRQLLTPVVLGAAFFSHPTMANDRGFNNFQHPVHTGQRTISVNVINSRMDQNTPVQQPTRNRKLRLELHYSLGNENFRQNRIIVPELGKSCGKGCFNVKALLPQLSPRSLLNPAIPQLKPLVNRANDFRYHLNPTEIPVGMQVKYTWKFKEGSRYVREDVPVRTFTMPRPFVIAAMGDSFAAGEGAPNVAIDGPIRTPLGARNIENFADWSNRGSHRSRYSGFILGIQKFQRENLGVWVKYKHTAISSATLQPYDRDQKIKGGMLSEFRGARELWLSPGATSLIGLGQINESENRHTGQIRELENWITRNRYGYADVVLLSLGGNDSGFGDAITGAVTGSLALAFGSTVRSFEQGLNNASRFVDDLYREFDQVVKPKRIYWVNYPDLTSDENNRRSGISMDVTTSPSLMAFTAAVTGIDMGNAHILLKDYLNPRVRQWCGQSNTCRLIDVENRAMRHGINADPIERRWFNTFIDSQRRFCGGLDCSVHPNRAGFRGIYRDPVAQNLSRSYGETINRERGLSLASLTQNLRAIQSLRPNLGSIEASRKSRLSKEQKSLPRRLSIKDAMLQANKGKVVPQQKKSEILARIKKESPKQYAEMQAYMSKIK